MSYVADCICYKCVAEALTDFTSVEGCEYDRVHIREEIGLAFKILCQDIVNTKADPPKTETGE
jgi:hypothetical protein